MITKELQHQSVASAKLMFSPINLLILLLDIQPDITYNK